MGPELLQKKLEEEVEYYKKSQKDLSKTTNLRSQLDGQLNENKVVKEELDLINEENVVYKLIGPALIRQDLEEARQNVNKRVDYIQQEIKRHDNTMEKLEKDSESKRDSIGKLQQQMQQLMMKQMGK
ncbi:prefoldin subunit 6-like [Homarus americanus]|uniref:Probable prefoldin subunit 6 n=1 Tax=Homarus americanus TaxID=6706 RepID=A0A8J5JZ58_HOMAM|nr:prefoldin subunit 6-like [Homarus americanus]KAG7166647.1 Prefoldin subunit 6-like [Homarus americanus]